MSFINLVGQYFHRLKMLQMLKLALMASTFIFWSMTVPAFLFYCTYALDWPYWLLLILLISNWLLALLFLFICYLAVSISCKIKKELMLANIGSKNKTLGILISLIK